MKSFKNILTLGDIHGKSIWKEIIFGNETEYTFWRMAAEHETIEEGDKFPFHKWDKIIFVGDYVDDWDLPNVEILHNLKEIIFFASRNQDRVHLLLGNHDIQYIVNDELCSVYRAEMRHDLFRLFEDNRDLFRMAFLDKTESEFEGATKTLKTLWTHAGVTEGWLTQLKTIISDPDFRFSNLFKGWEEWEVDDLINMAWQCKLDCLFNVDYSSGGSDEWAGPIWVRPKMLEAERLKGYDQVVGHTRMKDIMQSIIPDLTFDTHPFNRDIITYVDALSNGKFHEIKKYL